MKINELEQKYNNLEERLLKVENYLRAQDKWHDRFFRLVHESQSEVSQGIYAQSNLQVRTDQP